MSTLRIRVIDLETSGASAYEVCEIGWQDVVLGPDGRWSVNEERGAKFVNPGRPISTATMAVHHIMDGDVVGAPFWREAAPDVLRPADGVLALAAHRAAFEQRYCTPALSGGARWICTWKCALRLWPEAPAHSNQALRYWRGLKVDRDIANQTHRAGPDAYVTAHLLRDMLEEPGVTLEQLVAWSAEPALLARCQIGRWRGTPWREIDDPSFLRWLLVRDFSEEVHFTARYHLDRLNSEASAERVTEEA